MCDGRFIEVRPTVVDDFYNVDLLSENYPQINFAMSRDYYRQTIENSEICLTFSDNSGIIGIVGIDYESNLHAYLDRRIQSWRHKTGLQTMKNVVKSLVDGRRVLAHAYTPKAERFLRFLGMEKVEIRSDGEVVYGSTVYIQ